MKGVVAALTIVVLTAPPLGAQTFLPLPGPDKVKHFVMSAFIQSASYGALRATGTDHRSSIQAAAVITGLAGLGKELHDARKGGSFSPGDIAWNAAGAGGAILLLERTRR